MRPARLYNDLADLWPLLSPSCDYASEASVIAQILHEHLGPATSRSRRSILEMGAGGGHTLSYFKDFDAVAVDLSAQMLAQCRRLNPAVQTHVGDMRQVRLGRSFDAVLAHDAIDYMASLDDLRAACVTAAVHLKPQGVFLVAPTCTTETYTDYESITDANTDGQTELAYVSYVHRPHADPTTYELVLVILVRQGGELRVEEDRHTCGMFPTATWIDVLAECGFDVQQREMRSRAGLNDRFEGHIPMFIGVRR